MKGHVLKNSKKLPILSGGLLVLNLTCLLTLGYASWNTVNSGGVDFSVDAGVGPTLDVTSEILKRNKALDTDLKFTKYGIDDEGEYVYSGTIPLDIGFTFNASKAAQYGFLKNGSFSFDASLAQTGGKDVYNFLSGAKSASIVVSSTYSFASCQYVDGNTPILKASNATITGLNENGTYGLRLRFNLAISSKKDDWATIHNGAAKISFKGELIPRSAQ